MLVVSFQLYFISSRVFLQCLVTVLTVLQAASERGNGEGKRKESTTRPPSSANKNRTCSE